MTRDIRFRGKRVDNGEWVYGSVRTEESRAYILEPCYSVVVNEPDAPALGCGVEDGGWQNNGYTAAEYGWQECIGRYANMLPVWVGVDPDTVGQSTGLCDKNGKEIWEGDFCVDNSGDLARVFYANGCFYLRYLRNDLSPGYLFREVEFLKVIGNATDNPDLLKEAK